VSRPNKVSSLSDEDWLPCGHRQAAEPGSLWDDGIRELGAEVQHSHRSSVRSTGSGRVMFIPGVVAHVQLGELQGSLLQKATRAAAPSVWAISDSARRCTR
jgi:hypothetical protein